MNNKNRTNNNINNNIKITPNESLQNIVYNNLSILFAEIDNLNQSRKVFKQIYTIISNMAYEPHEEKYRRFNIKNLHQYLNTKASSNYLQALPLKM